MARALRAHSLKLEREERKHRAQPAEVLAHRRVSDAADAFARVLEGELQREIDLLRYLSEEVRTERDFTNRHETESRLLRSKVRTLKGAPRKSWVDFMSSMPLKLDRRARSGLGNEG